MENKNIVVSWSTAYDVIMNYDWKFQDDIKADKLNNLSVAFLINNLKKEIWWTWANIVYNLSLLWERSILMSAIWKDFSFDGFFKENVNLNYIHESSDLFSASCHITSDSVSNQITTFYPWAMNESENLSLKSIKEEVLYTIVSPNQKEAMIKHTKESKELWIKTFFDPGQQIYTFNKDELAEISINANYLIVNEYERKIFKEKIWKDKKELLEIFSKIIVTLWDKWSKIISKEMELKISGLSVENVIDPTWAWDSYRAWLLRWLKLWYSWETSAKLWTLMASYCIQSHWWQNHFVEKETIENDMREKFGEEVKL